jgi:hypothetical protein
MPGQIQRPSTFGHGVREIFRSIASPIDTISAIANKSRWERAASNLKNKGVNNLDLSEGSEDLRNLRSLAAMSRNSRAMDNVKYRAARGDKAAAIFFKGRRAVRAAANDPSTANTLLQLKKRPVMSTLFGSVADNENQLNALKKVLAHNSPYASILSRRQLDGVKSGYNKLNTVYNIKRNIFGVPANKQG